MFPSVSKAWVRVFSIADILHRAIFAKLYCSCDNGDVISSQTLVITMKKLKILPGAAGIIALTATIGFVDGQRKIEVESFSRGRISLVRALTHIASGSALSGTQPDTKSDSPAYLVEIRRGNIFAEVLVDGITGRLL